MGKISVKRIDHGYRNIQAGVKALSKNPAYVKAGVLGKSKPRNDGKLTNAQLAIIHEFGTSTIPARHFIGPAYKKHQAEYKAILEKLAQKFLGGNGIPYSKVLGIIGAKMASDMKQFVTGGPEIKPTNAESTKRRKESKRAKGNTADVRSLVDTGRMVGSITFEVVGGLGDKTSGHDGEHH